MPRLFADKLMTWYRTHRRQLPWRTTRDPYKIWLSEVVLQQTRVAQGMPYYQRFVQHFPTVEALAKASEDQVLSLWQGLGYYRRAHNLHACARLIVRDYRGCFPDTYGELLKLPGIGSYTAAAIASVAFHRPEAVVDGNVYRVLARVFGMYADVATQQGKYMFHKKAYQLLDTNCPGDYNQAIMEFGALCCLPRQPLCCACVFRGRCVARKQGHQHLLPHKRSKRAAQQRYFTYFVLQRQGQIALRKRTESDVWLGLYDFYGVESPRDIHPNQLVVQEAFLQRMAREAVARTDSQPFKHVLSHQVISARFVHIVLPDHFRENSTFRTKGLQFYPISVIPKLPKSALTVRYLAEVDLLKIDKSL